MPSKKGIHIEYKVKTTKEYLEGNNLDIKDVLQSMKFLGECFGTKYLDMFPLEAKTENIPLLINASETLKSISKCEGFKRHLSEYDKSRFKSHFFTAKVSKHMLNQGYEVILEPEMKTKTGAHPDILIKKHEKSCYLECKTSNISNMYGKSIKQQVADMIYKAIPTCDQIDLYFKTDIDLKKVEKLTQDNNFIQAILRTYENGKDGKETRLNINEELEINIIQKPAIIGSEEDFLTADLSVHLHNIPSNIRYIGFSFMKGGRAIGVWQVPYYQNKLKDKKEQSEKQLVEGSPNYIFVDGSDVVGDPKQHKDFFDNYWLNKDLPNCTGVVFFGVYKDGVTGLEKLEIESFKNRYASIKFELDLNNNPLSKKL